jgi:hypothetical protein
LKPGEAHERIVLVVGRLGAETEAFLDHSTASKPVTIDCARVQGLVPIFGMVFSA